MMVIVDWVMLCVEHMDGYAGVMTGILWPMSCRFVYGQCLQLTRYTPEGSRQSASCSGGLRRCASEAQAGASPWLSASIYSS